MPCLLMNCYNVHECTRTYNVLFWAGLHSNQHLMSSTSTTWVWEVLDSFYVARSQLQKLTYLLCFLHTVHQLDFHMPSILMGYSVCMGTCIHGTRSCHQSECRGSMHPYMTRFMKQPLYYSWNFLLKRCMNLNFSCGLLHILGFHLFIYRGTHDSSGTETTHTSVTEQVWP